MTTDTNTTAAERAPRGAWLRTWLVALALAAGILGAMDAYWRHQRHRPTIIESVDLWAWFRRAATAEGALALVGDSRMLMDVDTATLRSLVPDRVIAQLGVNGHAPLATLRDLAHDEAFAGLVLCSATADDFAPEQRERQQGYVDHYHRTAHLNAMLDARLDAMVRERFTVTNWNLDLLDLATRLLEARPWPRPLHVVTHADRSRAGDYTLVDLDRHRARRIARRRRGYATRPPLPPETWAGHADDAAAWVQRIEERGGRVAFVRFPTTGEHWRMDREAYPREHYWDRIGPLTGALTLHFRDEPALGVFDCPDTSHLDHRDAPAFTRALHAALVRRGFFGGVAAAPR